MYTSLSVYAYWNYFKGNKKLETMFGQDSEKKFPKNQK